MYICFVFWFQAPASLKKVSLKLISKSGDVIRYLVVFTFSNLHFLFPFNLISFSISSFNFFPHFFPHLNAFPISKKISLEKKKGILIYSRQELVLSSFCEPLSFIRLRVLEILFTWLKRHPFLLHTYFTLDDPFLILYFQRLPCFEDPCLYSCPFITYFVLFVFILEFGIFISKQNPVSPVTDIKCLNCACQRTCKFEAGGSRKYWRQSSRWISHESRRLWPKDLKMKPSTALFYLSWTSMTRDDFFPVENERLNCHLSLQICCGQLRNSRCFVEEF